MKLAPAYLVAERAANKGWMTASVALLAVLALGVLMAFPMPALAAPDVPLLTSRSTPKGTEYSLTLQLLALMTVLTLLPSMVLMMTSFVRIIIVMSILRQAMGTGQTPPNMVLTGLAIFLSLFVMSPVLSDVYQNALVPYMNKNMPFDQALALAEKPILASCSPRPVKTTLPCSWKLPATSRWLTPKMCLSPP